MANRVGLAAIVVVCGSLLAACTASLDLDNGTYSYAVPATDHMGEQRVLVQDGVVTDVWISEDGRELEYYGYTPRHPGQQVGSAGDGTVTQTDSSITICWPPIDGEDHCSEWTQIAPLASGQARQMAAWDGIADGTYDFDTRSVTWDRSSRVTATIEDGAVTEANPQGADVPTPAPSKWTSSGENWVRYWIHGASEPFAACFDDPNVYDEESCWTWTEAST